MEPCLIEINEWLAFHERVECAGPFDLRALGATEFLIFAIVAEAPAQGRVRAMLGTSCKLDCDARALTDASWQDHLAEAVRALKTLAAIFDVSVPHEQRYPLDGCEGGLQPFELASPSERATALLHAYFRPPVSGSLDEQLDKLPRTLLTPLHVMPGELLHIDCASPLILSGVLKRPLS